MNNKLVKRLPLLFSITMLVFLLFGCSARIQSSQEIPSSAENQVVPIKDVQQPRTTELGLTVHFLDVGQADCTLLESDGHFMLIDAGDNNDENVIINYLDERGVQKIDYIIGTHPHADHIGSMDAVINKYEIETIYMPFIAHNTKTFDDVLTAIEKKGLKVTEPEPGAQFAFNDIPVTILGPVKEYTNLNNNSIVLKVETEKISFLFTGDAEQESEQDMLSAGYDLSAEFLKVGHHGSDTSSSSKFLEAVNPKVAIIPVGTDNQYGHPSEDTIKKLSDMGVETYRLDQTGNIIISTVKPEPIDMKEVESIDGIKSMVENDEDIQTVSSNGSGDLDNQEQAAFIGNINSKKFHTPDCSTLPAKKNQVYFFKREDAIENGFVPCKKCFP